MKQRQRGSEGQTEKEREREKRNLEDLKYSNREIDKQRNGDRKRVGREKVKTETERERAQRHSA